jgi:hypothetical protein
MKRYPLLVLPVLACSSFLFTAVLNRESSSGLRGAHEAPPEKGLPAGEELLARAVAELAPDKMSWLETAVWQQIQGEDGRYVAHGRYLTAPGQRQRLELQVRIGKTEGKLLLVCDGSTLCQATRVGQAAPVLFQEPFKPPPQAPGHETGTATSQETFLSDLGNGGLDRVLQSIRQHLTKPQVRRASWKGQPVFRIQGGWRADLPAAPRTCTVLLDARTLWPHRIEWSGDEGRDSWQIELREPLVNQPLPPARCARLFAVPNGDAEIAAAVR